MRAYVVDASVAAKWLLPAHNEPLSGQAIVVLQDWQRGSLALCVPDLFFAETANIMWKAVRRGDIAAEAGSRNVRWFGAAKLHAFSSQPLINPAIEIALKHAQTAYDSIYLALALRLEHPLLTADERLVNAVGSRFPVRWLGTI